MQLPVGVRLLALGINPPFSVDEFLESMAPESLILLSLFNPRPSSSPFRLPLFGFASVLLLMALFELMYGGEKVLGGPPLGLSLGLTLTTRATLSHAIKTAEKYLRQFGLRHLSYLCINFSIR